MQKKVLTFIPLMLLCLILSGQDCPDKIRIEFDQLPQSAKNHLSQYEMKYIDNFRMFSTVNGNTYQVQFEDENPYFTEENMMMIFDNNGNVLASEYRTKVTDAPMPDNLTNYMNNNFPSSTIMKIEMLPIWDGNMAYKVKYNGSDDKLFFTMEGNMICLLPDQE